MSSRRETAFAWGLLAPCLVVVAAFAFYPIAESIYLSTRRIILGLPQLGDTFVGLANFSRLLADSRALGSLLTTVSFVAASTILEVGLGLLMALALHRSFRWRGLARAALLIPWAIPTVVSSQMWRFILNDRYGLLNYLLFNQDVAAYQAWLATPAGAFWAIVAADVWKTASFAALLILAGLVTVPEELDEAAQLDGATSWQRFRHVTLPLIMPSLALALLFRTMDAFRVFDLVFVMTQGGPAGATEVLQFFGYKKIFAEGFLGYGSAVSVLVFVLVLAVSLLYLKLLGKRLLAGGPK